MLEASTTFKKYDITTKRRATQAFFLFLYFIFPFLGIFYYDVDSTNFVLLGKTIGVNNAVIFVIAFIALLIGVVTMAMSTGRSFCGWICPQNFLSEMINKLINKFAIKSNGTKKIFPYTVITILTIIISVAVSVSFMFYFGKPSDVFQSLISGQLNGMVARFALIFGALVFAGIGIFRHDFCKYACPYGIMQASVTDKNTMRVRFTKERSSDCINCNACNEVCYVNIEPRKLVQADPGCMNCGLCVEACHNVLEPMGVKKTLEFSKDVDTNKENLNNRATLVLFSTFILFSITFIYLFLTIPTIDLTLTRDDRKVSVIKNQQLTSDYFVQVMNQTSQDKVVNLKIDGISDKFVTLEKNNFNLSAGQKEKFDLKINAPKKELKSGFTEFYIYATDEKGKEISKVRGALFVPFD